MRGIDNFFSRFFSCSCSDYYNRRRENEKGSTSIALVGVNVNRVTNFRELIENGTGEQECSKNRRENPPCA